MKKKASLISILMESPLYFTLSMEERASLIVKLASYSTHLEDAREEKTEIGYESSSGRKSFLG